MDEVDNEVQFQITTVSMYVHPVGEHPLLSEGVTEIAIDDDGAGLFIVLRQINDDSTDQIRVAFNAFDQIVKAVQTLRAATKLAY